MIALEDFEREHAEALAQAAEFARCARKGIPPDRWASTRQMYLIAKGIEAMQQIMRWQAETLAALVKVDDGAQ